MKKQLELQHDIPSQPKVKPSKTYKKLELLNQNNKLNCTFFTKIEPNAISKIRNVGEIFDIRIGNKHKCYAKVIKMQVKTLYWIKEDGLTFVDGEIDSRGFEYMMEELYSDKRWWCDDETEFSVIFFEKVKQLNMFNGDSFDI